MLRLILGRAGAGKTTRAMNMFKTAMQDGRRRLYYIVPEQYSHDAERQLLTICGDTLSLHGEVLSFSRLSNRVFAECGGTGISLLDNGGRILLMSRAVSAVSGKLRMYGSAEQTVDFLEKLAAAAKELKNACVTPEELLRAAEAADSPLKEKLSDLGLILGAYDAYLMGETADPDDTLKRLADAIGDSDFFDGGLIWIDGFTDFTELELRVIEAVMKKNVDMTVCLTCDGIDGSEEIFEPARKTALRLIRMAEASGNGWEVVPAEGRGGKSEALAFVEKNLFLYKSGEFAGDRRGVGIFRAGAPDLECEAAASKVLELLREGYRLRDIAVAVCDWAAYGTLAENIFEKYGTPVYVSKKTDIRAMPPAALIENALETVIGGWEYENVFAYLKTGLTGIGARELDALENYVLKWNLKGSIWTREDDWTFPVSGYEEDYGGGAGELEKINETRRAVALPLKKLQKALKTAAAFGDKLRALYVFLEDIGLPERLREKSEQFLKSGELQLGDAYRQFWEILVRAFDQFYAIAGDISGSTDEFARLWRLLISQYDLGSIPISLDRVSLGDISRVRRRGCKCLIVIGACDDALPGASGPAGLISDGERRDLTGLGLTLPGSAEDRLYRELNMIYSVFSMPSDVLFVTWPESGPGGGEKRPSFVVRRIKDMFSLREENDGSFRFRLSAVRPAFELAASALGDPLNPVAAAAAASLGRDAEYSEKLKKIAEASKRNRGSLSPRLSSLLYGGRLVLSASRIDKFYACRYLYFLQYGLRAKPRKPAGFDAPTAGTFMHYILENVTREIVETRGGFKDVDDETCLGLMQKYVSRYVAEKLDGFKDKSSRFIYLFNRLVRDASFIVLDMARELKSSEFVPLDFELEFSDTGALPAYALAAGDAEVKIKGFVDRVDGWEHHGKLYLRVVDYKTGKKSFSLSDVLHGMNMQMLIYLFALKKSGFDRYGREIVPAGVLYAPAREEIVQASRYACAEEIDALRGKKLRRSGLLLRDGEVLEAMERGDEKKYIPVRLTADGPDGDSLAAAGQLERLRAHIDAMLLEIAGNVRRGAIQAEPYFKNENDNACLICDYYEACLFSEADGDRRRYLRRLKTDEAWRRLCGEDAP